MVSEQKQGDAEENGCPTYRSNSRRALIVGAVVSPADQSFDEVGASWQVQVAADLIPKHPPTDWCGRIQRPPQQRQMPSLIAAWLEAASEQTIQVGMTTTAIVPDRKIRFQRSGNRPSVHHRGKGRRIPARRHDPHHGIPGPSRCVVNRRGPWGILMIFHRAWWAMLPTTGKCLGHLCIAGPGGLFGQVGEIGGRSLRDDLVILHCPGRPCLRTGHQRIGNGSTLRIGPCCRQPMAGQSSGIESPAQCQGTESIVADGPR